MDEAEPDFTDTNSLLSHSSDVIERMYGAAYLQDRWNTINSRYFYYCSKKSRSSLNFTPDEDFKTASARQLDCYMDALLDRYIQQKVIDCAKRSDSNKNKSRSSSQKFDSNNQTEELMTLKLKQYEANLMEEKAFLESLDEAEKWGELEESYRKRSDEATSNFVDISQRSSKSHDKNMNNRIRLKKLQEINKSLLMGTNVNYNKDEEATKIMFIENI